MSEPNWIELDGAVNARDLGGRPVESGGRIRSARLLRADNPVDLSERDVRYLVDDLRLDTVVDLRTGFEVRGDGHGPLAQEAAVAVHHLSLFPEAGPGEATQAEDVLPWQNPDNDRARASARRTYLRYLDERPDSVLTALRLVAYSDGATLVHCAAGKDRTGVVVALMLASVGVPREEIVADYVASAERIDAIVARLSKSPTYADDPYLADVDGQRPRASTIEGFLDELESEDGGAATWLHDHGWTSADAAALRARLVED